MKRHPSFPFASADARAHRYVDTAHRASLLYSFAALLLARFVELSDLPSTVELVATGSSVVFFAIAIFNYMLHGALRDTDNVFDRSQGGAVAGGSSDRATTVFMVLLVVAEVGGFLILFWGFLRAQLL